MAVITIETLYKELGKQIKKGNGSKKILLSSDDEGNEYHEMFYCVTPMSEEFLDCVRSFESKEELLNNYVILG